jgi:Na+-driven multidrug efflux pump
VYFQLNGIWYAFPVADILAASVTYLVVKREIKLHLNSFIQKAQVQKEEALA